ncbi:MAG TPA: hypothetical protein VEZ41_13710 [Allosphingosinicella sp.]|jgi:hypothetical protein|nr:hypothetical protein [Allosphingosinicella sp.]
MINILLAVAAALSTPAISQLPPSDNNNQPVSTTAGEQSQEPRTCRRLESTGQRSQSRRVCMTRKEWKEYDREMSR